MPDSHPRRSPRRRYALLAAAAWSAGLLAMAPAPVSAHAELVSSDPVANATLPEAPDELILTFSEPIDPATATFEILDPQQQDAGMLGDVGLDASATTATLAMPALEPGTYTVSYQVVSAVDGHATAGLFAFLVDPTGTEPPPATAPTSSSPAVDGGTILARWLALAGALIAFGALVFWLRSGARTVTALTSDPSLAAGPWLLVALGSLLAFGGLALYLSLASRPIVEALGGGHGAHGGATGFVLDFAAPFGWTPFAIAMRIGLVASLVAFVAAIGRFFNLDEASRRGRPFTATTDRALAFIGLACLALALLGMSLAGHAASLGGPLFAAFDWVHLVAVGAWIGALPAVIVLARRSRLAGAPRGPALASALRHHSGMALIAAPIVAITGLANSPLVLGASRQLVASEYGNLLLAKALLFSVALGIGAANHFVVRARARPRLQLLLGTELVVGALAVMTAAAMVTIQPAANRQPVMTSSAIGAAHFYGEAGPASVHLAVNLPAPGGQRYQVAVADAESGVPREDVQKVFLTFTPPPQGQLAEERVELETLEAPGLYGVSGAYTPVIGEWSVEVAVRRAGAEDETTTFDVPVIEAPSPRAVPPPDSGVGVPLPLAALWTLLPAGAAAW
ncbi:MAG: copper resistance protein CopC, partial [Candidatus Limnocylindria bacterium]